HGGGLRLVARDTPERSVRAHEMPGAKPYGFLDVAPLEERRSHAVQTRRGGAAAGDLGALDPQAIARVRDEARPDPRDADELHDALVTAGFLMLDDVAPIGAALFDQLVTSRRATRAGSVWVAAERLPEIRAVHPTIQLHPAIDAPAAREAQLWTRDAAIVELLRGRMSVLGPATSAD